MRPNSDRRVAELLLIEEQMSNLHAERKAYAQRIRQLAGATEHLDELAGYLRMIEQINEASIVLAMQDDAKPSA